MMRSLRIVVAPLREDSHALACYLLCSNLGNYINYKFIDSIILIIIELISNYHCKCSCNLLVRYLYIITSR